METEAPVPTRNKQLTYAELRTIQSRDPDGGSTEPTNEDYKQFEAWVAQTYGPTALTQYFSNWEEGGTYE